MTDPDCIRVPLELYPGMNPFVLDWLRGSKNATRFLPRIGAAAGQQVVPRGGSAEALRRRKELVPALIESNRRWGSFVKSDLKSWAAGETVTIVAGQQVGLAGGPLYTLAKIATLLRMKRDLESTGTPVTALFWLATEDHDFDEAARISIPVSAAAGDANQQLDLLTLRAAHAVDSRSAVGPLPIPESLITELLAALQIERPRWLREGITFGDSFAELIAGVIGPDLILVDSLLPDLRRVGVPLFENIFENFAPIERRLSERSAELRAAGYRPQVEPRPGDSYSLLFELDQRWNRRLITSPKHLIDHPERISTSALTRPLLQDFVLQPDVFVGGPSEVAYYAQVAPLHELLDVHLPRVALRGHALIASQRILEFLGRFGIEPAEIFRSPEEMLVPRESEAVGDIRREAQAGRRELMAHIERIGELALPADHAVARAINRSIGHIEYHFEKLTSRAIRALVRKDRNRFEAAKKTVAMLYPDRHVQDRIVAWFPLWLRHERGLVDRLIDSIEPDADVFEIIGL